MERVTTIKLVESTQEYHGALCGMVLGDGNIDHPISGNCRLRFGQMNHEYALWKRDLLERAVSTTTQSDAAGMLRVQTKRHPYFTKMWNHFYYNGRKTVEPSDMQILTPLGLAIWYMDDGDLQRPKLDVHLSTCNFTFAEHLVMQKGLLEKFNLHFNIHSRKSRKGGKLFYFRLKSKDRIAFFSLINPFKIDSMSYKFLTTEEEFGISLLYATMQNENLSPQQAGKVVRSQLLRYSLDSQETERGARNELPLS